MPITVNLRHLERGPLSLKGEISAEELELSEIDELIHVDGPVVYELEASAMERSVLVEGRVGVTLHCECARCLKEFERKLELADWKALLALDGDEAVKVASDCVDLTPLIREDILLELPQRPLCQPDCRGLPNRAAGKPKLSTKKTGKAGQSGAVSPDWAELNKLKF